MEALKTILISHAVRYPEMQPTDAVKLLYQNEFGGGHLVSDEAACLARLAAEYKSIEQSPDESLTEDIGNGMVRVNLRALDAHGYSISQLGDAFLRSAAQQQGSLDSFLEKLRLLRQMTGDGLLPFSAGALDLYLESYKKAGYPMVSHSNIYRAAYKPAYRIIRKSHL